MAGHRVSPSGGALLTADEQLPCRQACSLGEPQSQGSAMVSMAHSDPGPYVCSQAALLREHRQTKGLPWTMIWPA